MTLLPHAGETAKAGLPERTHSPVQERCGIGIHEASGK